MSGTYFIKSEGTLINLSHVTYIDKLMIPHKGRFGIVFHWKQRDVTAYFDTEQEVDKALREITEKINMLTVR